MTARKYSIWLLMAIYYGLVIWALWLVNWWNLSAPATVLTLVAGLCVADFFSGLYHLYIDYQPLNYDKGFDKILSYDGDRNSEEFLRQKEQVYSKANYLEMTVCGFKLHHRDPRSNLGYPYREFFAETVAPASLLLFVSLGVSFWLSEYWWASYPALGYIVASVGALHADVIHVCSHGSTAMPLGAKIVRSLQRAQLIYSQKTHGIHHRDGLTGFCFVTGHTDFLVNWICGQLLQRGIIRSADWHGLRPRVAIENTS